MSSYFEPDDPNVAAAAIAYRSGTTQVSIVRPDLALPSGIVIPGANAYSAWTAIAAANDLAAHMLILVAWSFDQGSTSGLGYFQIQIGTGGAGSEVAIATVIDNWSLVSNVGTQYGRVIPVIPFAQVPANARVAWRAAGNANVAGLTIRVAAGFIPRPL